MPLRFLLDENLRGGGLWQAIQKHNQVGIYPLDVIRVGDPSDLPLGALDPDILLWGERESRILISLDKTSLLKSLRDFLQSGYHSPGILLVRGGSTITEIFDLLVVAHAGDPGVYQDTITFIP